MSVPHVDVPVLLLNGNLYTEGVTAALGYIKFGRA